MLAVGASISCSHFQRFSNAVKHIVEYKSGCKDAVTNYLDDFLFMAPTRAGCKALVRLFFAICDDTGIPIAHEKTEWPMERLVFLGILLDGLNFHLSLPNDKVNKAVNWLSKLTEAKKTTVKELEQITGLLTFFNRAIVPGRVFTRRIYAKFASAKNSLKAHHHL